MLQLFGTSIRKVLEMPNHTQATVGGIISDVRISALRKPKPGQPKTIAFFQIEDLDATMRCAVWSEAYAKFSQFIADDAPLFLRGRVDKKESRQENENGEHEIETTLFVDEIIPFENAVSELSRGVAIFLKEEVADQVGVKKLTASLRRTASPQRNRRRTRSEICLGSAPERARPSSATNLRSVSSRK